jgi:hypothetical protein
MKSEDSDTQKKTGKSKHVLMPVAYGLALIETLVVRLGKTLSTRFAGWAAGNSTERDAAPICKNGRERFVWVHGFITGAAAGMGITTIGLCLALWMVIS